MLIIEVFGSLGASEHIHKEISDFIKQRKITGLSLMIFDKNSPYDEEGNNHILVKILTDDPQVIKNSKALQDLLLDLGCVPKFFRGREIKQLKVKTSRSYLKKVSLQRKRSN